MCSTLELCLWYYICMTASNTCFEFGLYLPICGSLKTLGPAWWFSLPVHITVFVAHVLTNSAEPCVAHSASWLGAVCGLHWDRHTCACAVPPPSTLGHWAASLLWLSLVPLRPLCEPPRSGLSPRISFGNLFTQPLRGT